MKCKANALSYFSIFIISFSLSFVKINVYLLCVISSFNNLLLDFVYDLKDSYEIS